MVKKKQQKILVCLDCGETFLALSRKGLCPDCGRKRSVESIRQMVEKEGELYDKWYKQILAGIKRDSERKKVKDNEP